MSKSRKIVYVLFLNLFIGVFGNLEGPFLFWGPKELSLYKRPALKSLEQDDLLEIYENQAAIVVFNNQDSLPLTSDNFPRLRKLLERKTTLVLPQDFLDVHPEYINNETQVITVQGPNSERDAEITETFERLEDIYGAGRVLGVLGSSSGGEVEEEVDLEEGEGEGVGGRRRRQTEEPKEAPAEVVYNASGKILFYTSDYPLLRYAGIENKTEDRIVKLQSWVGVSSDNREQFSRLIVAFRTPGGKVTLRFHFPDSSSGYWTLGPVELLDSRGQDYLLQPRPLASAFLGAPKGFSFRCSQDMVFSNGSVSLLVKEIQVQPQLNGHSRFGMAYNCIGFTTVPIWSGILVASLLILGTFFGISMISNIKVMDKFENTKGKTLTFTVAE